MTMGPEKQRIDCYRRDFNLFKPYSLIIGYGSDIFRPRQLEIGPSNWTRETNEVWNLFLADFNDRIDLYTSELGPKTM